MKILLIEDSPRLRQNIGTAIRRSGYAMDTADNGEEGLWMAENSDYDTVILDIMLPRLDGLSVLRSIRESGHQTPVLLLTAKDTVHDRVNGLNMGADDYLTKPFALEELLARVQALCRRKYQVKSNRIEAGPLAIDTSSRQVWLNQQPIEFKAREYALLEYLALRQGQVISRTEIEEHIYDGQVDPMSNVVESAICIIRRKLARTGNPSLIQTRRGQGYILQGG